MVSVGVDFVVCGARIEHWLNGHLMVTATVGSPDWYARIAQSKFDDVKGFGQNRCGRIMLTDHNDEVWFRNIYLRRVALPSLFASRTAHGSCWPVRTTRRWGCRQPTVMCWSTCRTAAQAKWRP